MKYIVDIKGEIEGDYEIIGKYEERPVGTWIKIGQSFVFPEKFRNYSCSECGHDIDKIKFNFCPNCGAKMEV